MKTTQRTHYSSRRGKNSTQLDAQRMHAPLTFDDLQAQVKEQPVNKTEKHTKETVSMHHRHYPCH